MTSNQQSAVEMREALEILLFRATQHEGFAAPEANYRAIEAATSALAKASPRQDALGSTQPDGVERVARAIYANVHHLMRVTGTEAQTAYEHAARAAIAAGVGSTRMRDLVFESLYHLRCDEAAKAYHERALAALDGHPDGGSTLMREALGEARKIIEAMPISEMVGRIVGEDKVRSYEEARELFVGSLSNIDAALAQGGSTQPDGELWRGHCEYLMACIDMSNEAGAPVDESDPEDIALIDEIRSLLKARAAIAAGVGSTLMREALEKSEAAIQAAYAQAEAEERDHMKIAARHEAVIRAFRELRDAALAQGGSTRLDSGGS